MAKARAISKRRKVVQNIRKITRTMQLIATARFQSAFKRAMASRPYVESITGLVEELSRAQVEIDHPLLRTNEGIGRSILLVLTSNRGLCGGYNAALLRRVMEHVRAEESAGRAVELHVVGKKGIAYFRFLGREMAWMHKEFEGNPEFAEVEKIAVKLMDLYVDHQVDSINVAYTRFVSASAQYPDILPLLPIRRSALPPSPVGLHPGLVVPEVPVEYEFSPAPEKLLSALLPEVVKVRLFQCFNDAVISEQTARMIAMKAATDSAGDMIKSLTQRLNRARQSQITLELLDIVSGAEALR